MSFLIKIIFFFFLHFFGDISLTLKFNRPIRKEPTKSGGIENKAQAESCHPVGQYI